MRFGTAPQRMDLPHNMSEEQARYMVMRTYRNQLMQQEEQRRKTLQKKSKTGTLGSLEKVMSEDLIVDDPSAKDTKTSLAYTSKGKIISEPNFLHSCRQKSQADYVKSSDAMVIKVQP